MSLLDGKHRVRVHDYSATGGIFKKAGWSIHGPHGHVVISSHQLHHLLENNMASISINKDAWDKLVHGKSLHPDPKRESLAALLQEHGRVEKEMTELRKKASDAYHDKKENNAARFHRMLMHKEQQLARVDRDIARAKAALN